MTYSRVSPFFVTFAVVSIVIAATTRTAWWSKRREERVDVRGKKEETMIRVSTELGDIRLDICEKEAPITALHFLKLIKDQLYDGACFYRSDFVIQGGLRTPKGERIDNPYDDIAKNEASLPGALSNKRGTVSVGHWDVPDNGNSEFFINLKDNPHLDKAYGGYAIWARVSDDESLNVVDSIAKALVKTKAVKIKSVSLIRKRDAE